MPGCLSFQSCSPFSWVRYSTREDGVGVDHQEVVQPKGTQVRTVGRRRQTLSTWTWTQERRKSKKIPIVHKECACNAGGAGSIPGLGRSPGGGTGNPLQYSCLENRMDGGAWWAAYSPWGLKGTERLTLSLCLGSSAATGGAHTHPPGALSVIPGFTPSGKQQRAGWVSCTAGRFFTTRPPGKPMLDFSGAYCGWLRKIFSLCIVCGCVVQSLSCVPRFATSRTAAQQTSCPPLPPGVRSNSCPYLWMLILRNNFQGLRIYVKHDNSC